MSLKYYIIFAEIFQKLERCYLSALFYHSNYIQFNKRQIHCTVQCIYEQSIIVSVMSRKSNIIPIFTDFFTLFRLFLFIDYSILRTILFHFTSKTAHTISLTITINAPDIHSQNLLHVIHSITFYDRYTSDTLQIAREKMQAVQRKRRKEN